MLLYYITDRTQFSGAESEKRAGLLDSIAAAARWGVDYIQLREQDLNTRELETLAHEALSAVRKNSSTAKLLINSRVDVAIAVGADGVHLRSGAADLSASEARVVFHKAGITNPVIASSCHTLEEIAAAEAHGASFAVFGPVFGKGDNEGVGIEALSKICQREVAASARMPVLALGGVTVDNAEACMNAGAAGVAGIRLFQSVDLGPTITTLRRMLPQTSHQSSKRRHPYQPG